MARVLVAALLVALAAAGGASGVGGRTIASAPIVRPGVAENEDTVADPTRRGKVGSETSLGCWMDYEYWRLPLVAGQRVAISGNTVVHGNNFAVAIFPAGTTDASIHAARSLVDAMPARATVHFRARTTGTYPLVVGPSCYDGVDGNFRFVVTVTPGG